MITSNLLTAYAVQSAVQAISDELAERYTPLEGMPIMFYDWDKGYTEQWKQKFAQIPMNFREQPWYSIVYSYGESKPAKVQPRDLYGITRLLCTTQGGPVYADLLTRLMSIDVVCTVLTADSNYADTIAMDRVIRQSFLKQVSYQDVFFPSWQPETEYVETFNIIPTVPDGVMYKCVQAGTTGEEEPDWPTEVGTIVEDGTVKWKCCPPAEAKLSLFDFTLPKLVQPAVYDTGVAYSLDFAFSINYVGILDKGHDLHAIRRFDNHLYQVLDKAINL